MADTWTSLSQPIYTGMPHAKAHGDIFITSTVLPIMDGFELRTTHLEMPAHGGTHIDAAIHFFPGARSIDEYSLEDFIGTGVVLDVRRKGAFSLSKDDIVRTQPAIKQGDFVFLCFGYGRLFGDNLYHDHPYLSVEAANWLVECGVRIVGVDTTTPDMPGIHRPAGFDFPVHRALLGNEVLVIENLAANLEAFVGERIDIMAIPLPIRKSDGSPVTVLVRRSSP